MPHNYAKENNGKICIQLSTAHFEDRIDYGFEQ